MSEEVVPSAVAHHIIIKFLTNEYVKPANLSNLRAQLGNDNTPMLPGV
jgi:hypothetical protein